MVVVEIMKKKKCGNCKKPQMNGKNQINNIQTRLSGWQLESFKDSYNHKLKMEFHFIKRI